MNAPSETVTTDPSVERTSSVTETPEAEPATETFASLQLDPRIVAAVEALGFDAPTPIQAAAMPVLLEGHDLIGRARTGSGKTAAFGLPLLERVKDGGHHVRALILAPTRELALQITEALRSFAKRLPVRVAAIYGGAAFGPQLGALRDGVPILVGTPGRVLDHMRRGSLDLSRLEMLVLDEADEMLRMGFIDDVEAVLDAAPDECQVALFSATMPEPIRRVAAKHLQTPREIQVESSALSVGHIDQRYLVVPQRNKADALARVLAAKSEGTTIVFARTRAGAAEISDALASRGLHVDALHGDLSQAARERVLSRLRSGGLSVVVATDVAARGIDVDHITHVINLDLPPRAEEYVHRIGRTGRAGREGVAISFVTPGERTRLRTFERALQVRIERIDVPSDAGIARVRRRRLHDQVLEAAKGTIAPSLEELARELAAALAEEELPEGTPSVAPELRVAAAAMALLADDRGLDVRESRDEPPAWARTKERPERRDRDERPARHDERIARRDRDERPARRERDERDTMAPMDHRGAPRLDHEADDRGEGRGRTGRELDLPPAARRGSPEAQDELELVFAVGHARGVRPSDLVGAIANEASVPGSSIGKIDIAERASFVRVPRAVAEHLLRHHQSIVVRGKPVRLDLARGLDAVRAQIEPEGLADAPPRRRPSGPKPFAKKGFGGKKPFKKSFGKKAFGKPKR
ncbi:MAG: DEAD/DEAH box helicase [Myxococcales bacterium]|nr:DEAD/DEAH box helicase [Myxococcales bacterium]